MYNNFINEEKGISNIVIEYINRLLKIFKNYDYCDIIINLNNGELPLYNLNIIFKQGLNYKGYK